MQNCDLPAIYRSADAGSNNSQAQYLRTIRSEYAMLSMLALLGEFRGEHDAVVISMILIMILLFGLLIFRFVSKLDRKWYACRALAESVKTSAWKFSMRAHPFDSAENLHEPVRNFLTSISQIRSDNEFIGNNLDASFSDKDQITEKMFSTRNLGLDDRIQFYLDSRIREQRNWYAKKSTWNANRRKFWFGFSVLSYIFAAVVLLSEEFGGPDLTWGFSFLIVIVTSSFGWIQVKRHGELAASYTLTAHEIGSIQALAIGISDETELSEFVNAAEFAFSREHTQWQARRDFG